MLFLEIQMAMADPGLAAGVGGQFPVFRHLALGQDTLGLSCPLSGKERGTRNVWRSEGAEEARVSWTEILDFRS